MLKLPRCGYCRRRWMPESGAVASRDFCGHCRQERRRLAIAAFSLRPVTPADFDGDYLLPRAMRLRRISDV